MMELLSLPDEMLASIFKYSKLETITKIRKMNQRLDRTMVHYGLNKAKIRSFLIFSKETNITVEHDIADNREKVGIFKKGCIQIKRIHSTKDDCPKVLKTYLAKAQMIRRIHIFDTVIDENWLNTLLSYQRSKRVSILLKDCDIAVPLENLSKVLAKFGKTAIEWTKGNTIMEGTTASDKVILSLLPNVDIISIGMYTDPIVSSPEITDECLREARKTMPKYLSMNNKVCSFTLEEVLKTIKTFKTNNMRSNVMGYEYWNFGYINFSSINEQKRAIHEITTYIDNNLMDLKYAKKDYEYVGQERVVHPVIAYQSISFSFEVGLMCDRSYA